MTLLLSLAAIAIALYALYEVKNTEIKKVQKKDNEKKEAEKLQEQLHTLKGCMCELFVKKPMMLIDVAYSIQGKIIDVDDEWVHISSEKGKKSTDHILKITSLKRVQQIEKHKTH